MKNVFLFAFALPLLALVAAAAQLQNPVVQTSMGSIEGIDTGLSWAFYDIPFALPPVGSLRFAAPKPAAAWAPSTFNATVLTGVGCPQRCELPPGTCPKFTSEDCLYLSVYVPTGTAPSARLPVMVYIPGGHFEQGTESTPLYSGQAIANQTGTIVVVTNYRLGALGFLVSGAITGNFGFMDQQLALTWVNENIHAFGGNPQQITLVGQSAGGGSIAAHLVSPLSSELFQQAVIHSSTMGLWVTTLESGIDTAQLLAAELNCSITDVACFVAASVDDMLDAQYAVQGHLFYSHPLTVFLPWNVYSDGLNVPGNQLSLIMGGQFQHGKPVMIGNVAQEAVLFIYQAAANPISKAEYEAIVTDIFKLHAPTVLRMFPANESDSRPALALLGTAYIFICPQRAAALSIANYAPTYTYHFNEIWSFSKAGWGPNYTMCFDAVCHGEELPFLFSSAHSAPQQFTPAEQQLSNTMIGYWGNFIATGNPNIGPTDGLADWPAYAKDTMEMLELELPEVNVISSLLAPTCDFFDKVGYNNGEGQALLKRVAQTSGPRRV